MMVQDHFRETERLMRQVSIADVAEWLLKRGYLPEEYVLPPSFRVGNFTLQSAPYRSDVSNLTRRQLVIVSYPKTSLSERTFALIHPWHYHDIVWHLVANWRKVLDHIFHPNQRIYTYSFPIPVTKNADGQLTGLRSGRMIYEWLEMAEKDLVVDAADYQLLARTDISNFYGSLYTHSIGWALDGREHSIDDRSFSLLGSKIDRLLQYSNDMRTIGLPIGSALSDLIAEIVLCGVDLRVSERVSAENIDFVAVRYKDDYRILCHYESDAKHILKVINEELRFFNLVMNESKTTIRRIPEGLYRAHDREYYPFSLRLRDHIPMRLFEHTLLKALSIHREYPGTSLLEKFLSELFDKETHRLKLIFSPFPDRRDRELRRAVTLLLMIRRESPKALCHVLAAIDELLITYGTAESMLKTFVSDRMRNEIAEAGRRGSVFETIWLVFFCRFAELEITNFRQLINNPKVANSEIAKSIIASRNYLFTDCHLDLFRTPKQCRGRRLSEYLAIFDRDSGIT